MVDPKKQHAALTYARATQPLDPDQGWRREDLQLAFMAGMEALAIPRLLSLPEAARVLNVSASTIHDLVRHGELAFVHAGRGTVRKHLTFSQDEIVNFIKRHTQRTYQDDPWPRTARHGIRKRAHELAVERASASGGGFMAQYEARRAAAKAKKK
ncbi:MULTISPECIES: helix-turn-helix domain-containing protein [Rhizobium]|uniref:Excisionase family DNA binding protein n=1 Tax=Rhizobium esperanzae TaxID=1967781 RepID=A0A7W6UFS3_9HYPH|nr:MULTISPECIES: helix-turn-helix domain-containing protein [Rhizobium]MBB4437373.1 excisionase family DNA binding protein [Rhizobium esperanzae]MDH6199949.1 excisionase family DNA binding protein [Rhizobium leguminosarum]